MTERDSRDSASGGPRLSERGKAAQADRKARQAEALRQNLRKRKEQSRARVSGEALGKEAAAGQPDAGEDGGTS